MIVLYFAFFTALSGISLVRVAASGNWRVLVGAAVAIVSAVLLFLLYRWAVLASVLWVASEAESLWLRTPPKLHSSPNEIVYEISPGIHQLVPLAFAMIVFMYSAWLWRSNALK